MKILSRMMPVVVLLFSGLSVSAEVGQDNLKDAVLKAREIVAQSRIEAAKEYRETSPAPEISSEAGAFRTDVERRIVVFREGTDAKRAREVVALAGGEVTHDLRLIGALALQTPKHSVGVLDAILANHPEVERVERDFVQNWLKGSEVLGGCPDWWPPNYPCPFPPDEGGGGAQKTPWGIERVGAPKAWATTRGDGIKVAVIDTGVESTHSELKVLGGYSSIEGDASWEDGHGHGTHVAGTIAAADNEKGVVGVAPNVDLYGVKVLNAKGEGTYATVIAGVQWAVENKMVIANMSLGGDETTQAFKDAMQAAADKGLTVVAAAGNNSGAVGYPAKYPSTIAVAASDSNDKGAYFSSRGPEVDVIAPGARIYSTFKGGGYKTLDGTSMASPHVAGLAALAAAATGARGVDAIRAALKGAATKLPGVSDSLNGAGMVNAEKLVSGSGLLTRTR